MSSRRAFDPANGGRPSEYPHKCSVFGEWLEACGMSVQEVAEGLEISPSGVYNLRLGMFRPGAALMFRIEDFTEGEVPVHAWKGRTS